MSAARDRKRREMGLDEGPKEDVCEGELTALDKLDTSGGLIVYGMTISQVLKLKEFYISRTGDTTLKELGK
jgi:hypothetical protein